MTLLERDPTPIQNLPRCVADWQVYWFGKENELVFLWSLDDTMRLFE